MAYLSVSGMYLCIYVCTMYVCMMYVWSWCMYACTYARMYVCMYVRMYMYVCMYVTMYVHVCMYICVYYYDFILLFPLLVTCEYITSYNTKTGSLLSLEKTDVNSDTKCVVSTSSFPNIYNTGRRPVL